jgi:D-threo-aldose 1-dehydrogenase
MQTVALPGTDLTPSRLAFGSAALMVRRGRRESIRLLEVANDSGITHFDTARSYGYGDAESALGEFLSRRREQVTVATKLGIVPPRRSRGLQAGKVLARVAANRAPVVRPLLRRGAQAMVRTGRFHPREARSSLETSLRELRTDAVDILLLHECKPEDLEADGLLSFLEGVVREGKVRYFGIATDRESTGAILRERPEFARVVQLCHNVLEPALEQLPALSGAAVITHSAVRTPLARLTQLMRDGGRCEQWSDTLGVDCAQPEALGRLLLAYALESNAEGAVLFASGNEERIRSNAALVDAEHFSSTQIRDFSRLVGESITVSTA